jgi:hypothetical protein
MYAMAVKKARRRGTSAMRTKGGGVSTTSRKKHGMKSKTARKGSFPIFDRKSATSALRLRGRARSKKDRLNIINRARKYAPQQAKQARQKDKNAGKI